MGELKPTGIDGAWLFRSSAHHDERGYFREWFRADDLNKLLGKSFKLAQSNISKSKKGVVRGIHFSTAPEGQAKWVTCSSGSIWDVVVDIRPSSPTFKKWVAHELNATNGLSVFISEGLGHAFAALADDSVITYLLSSPYDPSREFAINPQDPDINIKWPLDNPIFSAKDQSAPNLKNYLTGL